MSIKDCDHSDVKDTADLDDDFTPYGTPFSTPMKDRGSCPGSSETKEGQRTPTNPADVVQNLNDKFSKAMKE